MCLVSSPVTVRDLSISSYQHNVCYEVKLCHLNVMQCIMISTLKSYKNVETEVLKSERIKI